MKPVNDGVDELGLTDADLEHGVEVLGSILRGIIFVGFSMSMVMLFHLV